MACHGEDGVVTGTSCCLCDHTAKSDRSASSRQLTVSRVVSSCSHCWIGRRFSGVHWVLRAGRLLFRARVHHIVFLVFNKVHSLIGQAQSLALLRGCLPRMHGGRFAASAARRPAERLQPTPRAHMRASIHAFQTAGRRLTLRSRVARAAGAGPAASAQGVQTQLSSPQKADQHGSLAQHDAVYQARFIPSVGMIQSVVLPYVGPAQAAASGLRPPCDESAGCQRMRCCARFVPVAACCCTGLSSVLVTIPCASLMAVWNSDT